MALKRRLTLNQDKERIKRLESLLKEVTEELGKVVGYDKDKPIAPCSSYDCYK
jgi:hypothetical protein